jgi:hypothetical protein
VKFKGEMRPCLSLSGNCTYQLLITTTFCPVFLSHHMPRVMCLALQTGVKFKGEMEAKILKWQEPPPAKTVKPLDKPDAEVREGLW